MKKVEDELGVSLFDRDTIPLGLTPAGERYLEYLDQFQSLEQEMYAEFSANATGQQNCLTIATLPLLGIYVLPKIIPDFAELYPSIDLHITECSSGEILKQLDDESVDLVLTNLKPAREEFAFRQLLRDPLLLAAPYDARMRRRFPRLRRELKFPHIHRLGGACGRDAHRAARVAEYAHRCGCRLPALWLHPPPGDRGPQPAHGAEPGMQRTGDYVYLPLLRALHTAPATAHLFFIGGGAGHDGYSGGLPEGYEETVRFRFLPVCDKKAGKDGISLLFRCQNISFLCSCPQ